MLYRKNFFLDMFLGVPFQVGLFRGSVLTVLPRCRFVPRLQCYRAGRTRSLFSSLFFRVAGSSLTCNVPERGGHAAFPSPSFRVAGSSLTCNVTERFGQPCSLTIPNAEKRLPALLPGHLSSAWYCQTERNTCRLSHGCTPFRCGVGLRRYGLRCRLALHRVPR